VRYEVSAEIDPGWSWSSPAGFFPNQDTRVCVPGPSARTGLPRAPGSDEWPAHAVRRDNTGITAGGWLRWSAVARLGRFHTWRVALGTTAFAQCPGRALPVQDRGVIRPHPHLHAHEVQILASNGHFQPARWTVVPALAGTMCRHAGKIRQQRLPDPPFLLILDTI
jgi:hypothetical protein